MGIFDKFIFGKAESEAIIKMVSEQGLIGRKIYFNNLKYSTYSGLDKNGENIYIEKEIEYVIVNNTWDTDGIIYSVDGFEGNKRDVDLQVVTMVYYKLQDYVREFEEGNI